MRLRLRLCCGFSIIEILAVVAVIAILAAICFPLLSRTRHLSHRVHCINNLRQMASAFTQYSDDWNGVWPSPGGLIGDRNYWAQKGNGGIQRYIKQRGVNSVWCCPHLTDWRGIYPARSYSMNSYLRRYCDIEYPSCIYFIEGIQVTKIPHPDDTILLFEGVPFSPAYQDKIYSEDQIYYIYRCANWAWVRGYYDKYINTIASGKPWHGDKNNYLYCDGHIISRRPGRKTTGTLSTYREMREWYVIKSHTPRTE